MDLGGDRDQVVQIGEQLIDAHHDGAAAEPGAAVVAADVLAHLDQHLGIGGVFDAGIAFVGSGPGPPARGVGGPGGPLQPPFSPALYFIRLTGTFGEVGRPFLEPLVHRGLVVGRSLACGVPPVVVACGSSHFFALLLVRRAFRAALFRARR